MEMHYNTKTLKLKKRLIMYPYQETVVKDIIDKFYIGKPYVLGSCPSSGKTEMAIETMIRLLELGMVNRVLILAHSTNVLKENFYNRLTTYFNKSDIAIMKGQPRYNYDALIQVMIPQNIKHIKGQFDLVVTDEAHHNVLAEDGQYSQIIEKVEPKFELLLTGTPSKFIRENDYDDTLPYYINVLGMDMVGFDRFHDVKFDLIKSAYTFRNEDYSERTQNLLEETKFNFKDTETTINNVIRGVVTNIALRNGMELSKDSNFNIEGEKLIKEGKFGKTLIMCRSIVQANQISRIISKAFNIEVKVSQSENDTESRNLRRFKNNEFDFLCVVNRAREGYDDKKVVNLIDVTLTHNIDLIYQMFCRVVRLDEEYNNTKLYIKVTSNAELMPEYTMNVMTAALMLGSTDNLSRFNGNNFRGIVAPRIERVEPDDEDDPTVEVDIVGDGDTGTERGERTITRQRMNNLLVMDLVEMFVCDIKELIDGNERYAVTTLGESLDILSGNAFWRDKEGYFKLCREYNLTSETWRKFYKNSECPDPKYKLTSIPWRLFNQTAKEFFDECHIRKQYWLDKEGYFKLCREHNLNSSNLWSEKYKELYCPDPKYKLASAPWVNLELSKKEFFDECFGERQYWLDKEGYFQLCREHNLNTILKWRFMYLELKCPDSNYILYSDPWKRFNQTGKEFFDECFIRKQYWENKEGYFQLCRGHNLNTISKWRFMYLELKCPDYNYKLIQQPWVFFNQSAKEFFNECFPIKRRGFLSEKEGYFKLFRNNDITSSTKWVRECKNLELTSDYRLYQLPWIHFNQSIKEFFDEYREWLKDNPKPQREYRPFSTGEFSTMNKDWSKANSKNTHTRLSKDKSEWDKYHKLYREARENWGEIPYIEIAKKITPNMVVADFGCGENLLSKEIPNNKVHAFDHVAIDDSVIACDISNTPLENDSMDVVVFSLSLMGSNYKDYLKEAYRVLKPYGMLFICEPIGKGERNEEKLNEELTEIGFNCLQGVVKTERFMYLDAIKY
jgi:superfamily II DNA or RNA helicase